MTEEARRELEQTFRKPFESPSTVVVDFKPSEVIKKVDEIAETEAASASEPEAVPEAQALREAVPAREMPELWAPEVMPRQRTDFRLR